MIYFFFSDNNSVIDNLIAGTNDDEFVEFEFELSNDFKSFRLSVKRNLLTLNPELRNLSKNEMQQELEILFNEMINRYRCVYKFIKDYCNQEV